MSENNSSNSSGPIRGFFAELINRRVLQIGGAYIASAWLCAEIFDFLFEQFQAPDWAYHLLAIILAVGFPISMVIAWVVQVSEDGHWEIDHTRGDSKTLTVAIVIGLLITAGLSWQILPQRKPLPVYEPMPVSLAVLPFASTDLAANEKLLISRFYLSLMKGLEQSPELTLVRLESAGWPDDLPAFGKQIGVESLAFGFSSRSMEGVSFEMKMLDVVTGENSWSQTYTWNDKPTPEIALTMANELLQTKGLSKLAERQFTGTRNRSAYQAFLDGMMKARSLESEQLTGAIENFETAIIDDPGYSFAYTGLAQATYDLMAMDNISESESQALEQRASHAVDMARKLDPDSADAISLFALELDNSQLRIQAWERALELDSDHVISLYRYAMQLKEDGKLAEAERLLRRAVRLSPMNDRFRSELAAILSLQGREEEAQAE